MIHICQKVKHYSNVKSNQQSPLDSKSNPLSLLIIIQEIALTIIDMIFLM
jgi:hypothetical protein